MDGRSVVYILFAVLSSALIPAAGPVYADSSVEGHEIIYVAQTEYADERVVATEELVEFFSNRESAAGGSSRGIGGVRTGRSSTEGTGGAAGVEGPRKRFFNILFDTALQTIKGDSFKQLDAIGMALRTLMREDSRMQFVIEGHTDNAGEVARRRELSLQYAYAVKKYIVDRFGLEESRIGAVGLGSDRPVASNYRGSGRSGNRRIEIIRK